MVSSWCGLCTSKYIPHVPIPLHMPSQPPENAPLLPTRPARVPRGINSSNASVSTVRPNRKWKHFAKPARISGDSCRLQAKTPTGNTPLHVLIQSNPSLPKKVLIHQWAPERKNDPRRNLAWTRRAPGNDPTMTKRRILETSQHLPQPQLPCQPHSPRDSPPNAVSLPEFIAKISCVIARSLLICVGM